jgi:tripartite-type tricarboxylate transporter receptor subunit TctC
MKDLDIEVWVAVAASSEMAVDHRKKLEAMLLDILKTPKVKQQLATQGWDVAATPADAFASRLKTETSMLADIIKKQNIRSN